MVLGACLVEVGEVDAHPPLPVGFVYHYWISEPLWMEDFSDKGGFEKLFEFFSYGLFSIGCESPQFLLNWLGVGSRHQFVLNHLPWNSWHV